MTARDAFTLAEWNAAHLLLVAYAGITAPSMPDEYPAIRGGRAIEIVKNLTAMAKQHRIGLSAHQDATDEYVTIGIQLHEHADVTPVLTLTRAALADVALAMLDR